MHIKTLWDRVASLGYSFNADRYWTMQLAHAASCLNRAGYDDSHNRIRIYPLFTGKTGWGKSHAVETFFRIVGMGENEIFRLGALTTPEALMTGNRGDEERDEDGKKVTYVTEPPLMKRRYVYSDELLANITNPSGGGGNIRLMADLCTKLELGRGEWNKQGTKSLPVRPGSLLKKHEDGTFSYYISATFVACTTKLPWQIEKSASEMGFLNRFWLHHLSLENEEANELLARGPLLRRDPAAIEEMNSLTEEIALFNNNLIQSSFATVNEPSQSLVNVANERSGRPNLITIANGAGRRTEDILTLRYDTDVARIITTHALLRIVGEAGRPVHGDALEYKIEDAEAAGEFLAATIQRKIAQILQSQENGIPDTVLEAYWALFRSKSDEIIEKKVATFCAQDLRDLLNVSRREAYSMLAALGAAGLAKPGKKNLHTLALNLPEEVKEQIREREKRIKNNPVAKKRLGLDSGLGSVF